MLKGLDIVIDLILERPETHFWFLQTLPTISSLSTQDRDTQPYFLLALICFSWPLFLPHLELLIGQSRSPTMTNPVKPRHEMSIDTASSYFDQTIGLSQGIINRSFKRVFDMVKAKGGKVAKMILNTESQGMLNAELDAPSVFIMGASEESARIFYLLRLKSGIATLESGQELDLSGWSFAVETPLRQTVLSVVAGDTEDEMNEKGRILKEIGDKYRGFVAGDYRVQRVFCALAEANWMTPDGTWSKAVVNGESMKLRDWRKTNDTAYNSLNVLLRLWAERQRDPTITSMGLKFELNPEKQLASHPNPTFRKWDITTPL
jgi:hypothetical protein